MVKLSHNYS